MRKEINHCKRLLAVGLLALLPQLLFAAKPSTIMSHAMLAMMDAMGDLAHRFKSDGNWSFGNSYSPYSSIYGRSGYPYGLYGVPGTGWPGGVPLQSPLPGSDGLPAQGPLPLASPLTRLPPAQSIVDGIWLGRGGEIVLVMYGHFRIYASAEVYRDGRFELTNDRLLMYDPESERKMVFDYYLEDGRMILRNRLGDLLLFKQLPIPIPPYNLFSNPVPVYEGPGKEEGDAEPSVSDG